MKMSPKLRSFTTRAGAALALVAAFALVGVGPANAGPQHQGTDPAATGCNQNSTPIGSRPIQTSYGQVVATATVFYSSTCQTNWVRVDKNNAGGDTVKLIGTGGTWLPPEVDYGTGSSYSMQVYAPGQTCVNFKVTLKYPNGSFYAGTDSPAANHETIC